MCCMSHKALFCILAKKEATAAKLAWLAWPYIDSTSPEAIIGLSQS